VGTLTAHNLLLDESNLPEEEETVELSEEKCFECISFMHFVILTVVF